MAKTMNSVAVISFFATIAFSTAYIITSHSVLLTLAITSGTIAYHFIMRLLVGLFFDTVMKNGYDYNKAWYRVSEREMEIYKKLRVKKWKDKMPTYNAALYDSRIHTWHEIARTMCRAELVHEAIIVLSFLPVLGGIRFGAYPVFIATSVLSALFDFSFVIMQRYNRQRIVKLLALTSGNNGRCNAQ